MYVQTATVYVQCGRRISSVEWVDPNQIWKLNLVDSIDPGQLGEPDRFCRP